MDHDADPKPDRNPLLQRLADVRWILLAACVAIGYAAFDARLGPIYAAGALVFILAAALILPDGRSRRAEAARLRRSRSAWPDTGMKVAVDAFPLPCIIVDPKSIVRHGNKAASELLGPILPGDPLAFRSRVPQLLSAFEAVVSGGGASSVEWTDNVHSDRVMEARLSPVHLSGVSGGDSPVPDFIFIVFFDLTELHKLDRMRADFVANASHELRTPLASLTGFIETLQGPARNDEKARENFLAVMLEQSNRMGRLIDDLLSLSRIEMKGHIRPVAETDLRAVLTHVVKTMTPLADERSVQIEFDLQPAGMPVMGDYDELVQVFANLIENALNYGASGGKIEIAGRLKPNSLSRDAREPEHYEIGVRDWGAGIAPEHLPRLTERFYRADGEKGRSSRGTGLGLAIVKHIVSRHGGRMQIRSEVGKGAVFTIFLPTAAKASAADFQSVSPGGNLLLPKSDPGAETAGVPISAPAKD